MTWTRWAERLACVALGAGVCWFATYDPLSASSLDESIRRMHGKRFIVIGHDPDSPYPWSYHRGSRGTRGEAAADWTTMTYRTPEEMEAAYRKAFPMIPTTSEEP